VQTDSFVYRMASSKYGCFLSNQLKCFTITISDNLTFYEEFFLKLYILLWYDRE